MNDALKDEIEKEVMEKVASMLFGAMVSNVGSVQSGMNKEVRKRGDEFSKEITDNIYEGTSVDETIVKMADMWSDI